VFLDHLLTLFAKALGFFGLSSGMELAICTASDRVQRLAMLGEFWSRMPESVLFEKSEFMEARGRGEKAA
jgi:hypothetical protein